MYKDIYIYVNNEAGGSVIVQGATLLATIYRIRVALDKNNRTVS